jgi:hypothetical protein
VLYPAIAVVGHFSSSVMLLLCAAATASVQAASALLRMTVIRPSVWIVFPTQLEQPRVVIPVRTNTAALEYRLFTSS